MAVPKFVGYESNEYEIESNEARLQKPRNPQPEATLTEPEPIRWEGRLQRFQDTQQEAISDVSDLESSIDSEFEIYKNTSELAVDIATTHQNNEELKDRVAVKQFFEKVKSIDSLKDDDQREWIGSLPSRMATDAIPLFTNHDTKIDYQLHFSYTWMNALHTYDTPDHESGAIADYYVHSLLHVEKGHKPELISDPNLVIPLGKLFVNESGHSEWTGYEILISSSLELWIIYIFDEDLSQEWSPKKCDLLRSISDGATDGQKEKSPSFKIARLWTSLRTLETASFSNAANEIWDSYSQCHMGSFYLLEISIHEVLRAISFNKRAILFNKPVHGTLVTRELRVNAESPAGRELLELAIENEGSSIIKLEFLWQENSNDSLEYLATTANDRDILKLLKRKKRLQRRS